MSKIAVVYWSGTGNTEQMANCIAEGAKGAGADVDIFNVTDAGDFTADQMGGYDVVAFGCSSQGSEQLEEAAFEPMFAALEDALNRQESRAVRLLRLGRRPVDAGLERPL